MKPRCWSTWPVIPSFSCRHGPCWTDPHSPCAKGTISLVERQLDRQRERIEQLEQGDHRTGMGVASENERIFPVHADLPGDLRCQTLFGAERRDGKAFVQRRLRLTGLRLWPIPGISS